MSDHDLHPDVALAIAHRQVRERYEDGPPAPEPDLRQELRELAEIVDALAFANMMRTGLGDIEREYALRLHEQAHALKERVS